MERDEREELNRVADHEVKGHFPAGRCAGRAAHETHVSRSVAP